MKTKDFLNKFKDEQLLFERFEGLHPDWEEMPAEVFADALEFEKEQLNLLNKSKPFHGYNPKKHARTGGLNAAGRAKFKREQGANLKPPVTEKNPKGKRAARRRSFCARMSGVPGPTSKEGELTPKGAALKRWRCSKALTDILKDAYYNMPPEDFKLEKGKICAAGIAWAKRKFDTYPSAYANLAASKYCKDPNYGKNKAKKALKKSMTEELDELYKGALQQWLDEKWVRIGTDGKVKGECGTSKNKKNPDRCMPQKRAHSLSQQQRAKSAKKKKKEGAKGKTVVANPEGTKVTKEYTKRG